jgi:hypothetical protein
MQVHLSKQQAAALGLPVSGKAIELYEVMLVSEQQVQEAAPQVAEQEPVQALREQLDGLLAEKTRLSDEVLRLTGELEASKAPPLPESEPKKRGK